MLPHETEVRVEIASKYRTQLDAMTGLHDAVMGMLVGGSWTVRKTRGLAPFVAETMIGLLTKACKTFRAVQILCESGLHLDASALGVCAAERIRLIFGVLRLFLECRSLFLL